MDTFPKMSSEFVEHQHHYASTFNTLFWYTYINIILVSILSATPKKPVRSGDYLGFINAFAH